MKKIIDKFDGEYAFLSNFYPCEIHIDNDPLIYTSVENAFQASKTTNQFERLHISVCTPGQAKRRGRNLLLRNDWEEIKDDVMYNLVSQKFSNNKVLKQKLLETGVSELVEGNYWNDCYWGVCNEVGQNKLGKILMKVREEVAKSS